MSRLSHELALLAGAALALGCGGPPAEALPAEPPAFPRGVAPVETGWEEEPAKLGAGYCGACHAEAHEEWSAGMHSQSWRSPLFQRAFALEPRAWCENCHAPLAAQRHDPALRDQGINCAACHVRGGRIFGPRASDNLAHEVIAAPRMSTAEFCAGCHQFNFPRSYEDTVTYSDEPMQDTHAEWLASGQDDCQSCHYDGHRLLGPHDPDWLRAQFSPLEHEALAPHLMTLGFALAPRGHITPTGDLFRSLLLQVATREDFATIVFEKRWGRSFKVGRNPHGGIWNRALREQSGIPPGQSRVSLTLDTPPAGPLWARLVFSFHDPRVDGRDDRRDPEAQTVIWTERLR